MLVLVPVLFALIGALVYALSGNTKVAELGRLAFACGLLVSLLAWAGHGVKLLP